MSDKVNAENPTLNDAKSSSISIPEKHPKCKWFGKRFGGYNDCINCESEDECRESTGVPDT